MSSMNELFRKQLAGVQAVICSEANHSPLWAWYELLLSHDAEQQQQQDKTQHASPLTDRVCYDIVLSPLSQPLSAEPVSLSFSTRHSGACLRVWIEDANSKGAFQVRTDSRIAFELADLHDPPVIFTREVLWPKMEEVLLRSRKKTPAEEAPPTPTNRRPQKVS